MNRRRQTGTTLVELVVAMVIISIVATSAMMLIMRTAGSSADPLIRIQAIAIAESYMEEILAQALLDPSGGDTGGPEAGEVRATYDDVTDYHGLADNNGAFDQAGNAIAELAGYNVAVSVSNATLNGGAAKRIAVTVSYDGDADFTFPLTAYRLN